MKKVLIVSDEKELLETLGASLLSHEFSLHTLPGHENILTEISQLRPDLILIDFLLESANGGSLCHQIRGHEHLQNLPVILLCDYPNMERFTSKFGCNAIIHKPVKASELIEALGNIFNSAESESNFLHQAS